MLIRKVFKTKSTKQLMITIPKDEGIKEGDYVQIVKVENKGIKK